MDTKLRIFRFAVSVVSEGSFVSLLARVLDRMFISRAGQLIAEFTLTSAYRVGIPKLGVYRVQEGTCTRRGTWAFRQDRLVKDVEWRQLSLWQLGNLVPSSLSSSFRKRGRERKRERGRERQKERNIFFFKKIPCLLEHRIGKVTSLCGTCITQRSHNFIFHLIQWELEPWLSSVLHTWDAKTFWVKKTNSLNRIFHIESNPLHIGCLLYV